MTIVLSHTSALEAMRSWNLRRRLDAGERCTRELPSKRPSLEEQEHLLNTYLFEEFSEPLEVLLACRGQSYSSGHIQARSLSTPLPSNSLIELDKDVYCVCPELLTVLMASSLSPLELIVLLSELMGTYAVNPNVPDGMFERFKPLTDPASILAYLEALGPVRGTRRVRNALALACVNSASPRETKLSLRLGLKPSMGGYGLKVLSMNDPIKVRRIKDRLPKHTRKPDILLAPAPGAKNIRFSGVAFEYNGSVHNSPEQRVIDDHRSNELLAVDFKDYVIEKSMYRDMDYMDGIVDQARRDLGYPPLKLGKGEALTRRFRREQLYRDLEHPEGIEWRSETKEREERNHGSDRYVYEPVEPNFLYS